MPKAKVYQLPCAIAEDSRLLPNSKILYAVLRKRFGPGDCCSISESVLAERLGVGNTAVRCNLRKLQGLRLIKIKRGRGTHNQHYIKDDRAGESIPLPADVLDRYDLSAATKLVFCYISHSQGANDWVRLKSKKIAGALSLSVYTVRQVLRRLEARGMIQAWSEGTGCSKGNEYRVTSARRNAERPGISPWSSSSSGADDQAGDRPGP